MDSKALEDLQKAIADEKKKTTLLLIRIGILSTLLGTLLFFALTISASVAYFDRSGASLITGYILALFLAGSGISVITIYKPNIRTGNHSTKPASGLNFGNGLDIGFPYLRLPNELSKTVDEFKPWFFFFGTLVMLATSLMISAEAATLGLGLDQYIRIVRYSRGLTIGLSSLYLLSGGLFFTAALVRGRKTLLLTLLFAILTFVGGIIHTVIAGNNNGFWLMEYDLGQPQSLDRAKALLSQTAEGNIHYPYWPLFPLEMALTTPVVVVVAASFPMIFFCLHALIGFRGEGELVTDIKESPKVGAQRDLVLASSGIILILLGAAIFISIFAIRCLFDSAPFWLLMFDRYLVYFFFTFAGQACLLCSSKPRGKAVQLLLFLLSIAIFITSVMLLVNQVGVMRSVKSSDANEYPCSQVNVTSAEFCIWQKAVLPPTAVTTTPNYDDPYYRYPKRPQLQQHCIPLSQKCDGVVDIFPYNNNPVYKCKSGDYSLQKSADESTCGSTRYIWLVLFNLASGAVAIPISIVIFSKTARNFVETVKLVAGLFLWLYNPLSTMEQASDVESTITAVNDFN